MRKQKAQSESSASSDIELRLDQLKKKADQQKIIASKILQGLDKQNSSIGKKKSRLNMS